MQEVSDILSPSPAGSFAALSAFSVSQQSYKLVNTSILDGGSDTHICNDPKRFNFTRIAGEDDIIIVGKTTHQIEVFGTVDIIAKSSNGLISIRFLDVALIIEHFTNLVCLHRFEQKGIFHDFENSRLQGKGKTFCYVERVGNHKMIESTRPIFSKQSNLEVPLHRASILCQFGRRQKQNVTTF